MEFKEKWDSEEVVFEDTDTLREIRIVKAMFDLMKALVERED